MATTVIQAFDKFKSNLEITGLQSETVSARQQNVRNNVANAMTVIESFLTGSYRRNTMIAPLKDADIDVFVVLDDSYYDNSANGAANVLARVKRVIDNAYSVTTQSSRDGQAITIKFSDFIVDVVPSFNATLGGYLIPDPTNSGWIRTNPKTHVDLWSQSNYYHDYRLVPFIKMIKAWNRAHSMRFHSFHLESVVRQVFTYQKISNYADASLYFFNNAYNNIWTSDPAGYGGSLATYLAKNPNKLADIRTSLDSAARRSSDAVSYNYINDNANAIANWRIVFGNYFPSFG